MDNGCMNRPDQTEASGYWAQAGWILNAPDPLTGLFTRTARLKWVPHAMSRECEYGKSTVDAACDGCVSKRESV